MVGMTLEGNHDSRERFRRSLTAAQVTDLLGLIRGKNTDLVSYEEVARRVKAYQQVDMGTQMVPLNQIVGSVGRYRDFTREFLPRTNINKERWTRVDNVMNSMEGYPPIELYKVGEAYFVRDGNHRVSVAHANGLTHIEAYVTEVQTDVPLTLDDFERDRWLVRAEQSEFLRRTNLDELIPDHGIEITEPGRYDILLRHMFVHHYLRNQDLERENSPQRLQWEDAVRSWYENVYTPVVSAIREYDLLSQFPERTEADLYLWITHHRDELASLYDLGPLSADAAVTTFKALYDDRLLQRAYKGMRALLRRAAGAPDKPIGMSTEDFEDARARYESGERTIQQAVDDQNAAETVVEREDASLSQEDLADLAGEIGLEFQSPSLYLTAQ
jgi:hypothetical protein